jgi:hypothetical protein
MGVKSDFSFGSLMRCFENLSYRFKDDPELFIVFFVFSFKVLNPLTQHLIGRKHLFDLNERSHNLDIGVNGSPAL